MKDSNESATAIAISKNHTQKLQAAFKEFVAEVPVLLDELLELLQQSRRYRHVRVGFDDDLLNQIGAFYLDVVAGEEKTGLPLDRVDRIYEAFVGEALINRAGGKWVLGEDDFTYGTPSIETEGRITVSPARRRRLQAEDRSVFLRDWVDFRVNQERYNEEFFKEFEEGE